MTNRWVVGVLASLFLVEATYGQAPLVLGEDCTVTVGNQTAVVRSDGTFFVQNISIFESRATGIAPQLYRVRATCLREGEMLTGQSEFFSLLASSTTFVADVFPSELDPIPASISISAPAEVIPLGATVQLTTLATLAGGVTEDITPRTAGTTYLSTNPNVLIVDENGLVTGTNTSTSIQTGTIAVLNEGNLGTISFSAVGNSNDFDNDGMPNDWEELFGLNPLFGDANGDLDNDGLTNLEEFNAGTFPNNPDTDMDGIPDGVDGDPLHPEEAPPMVAVTFPSDGSTVREGETIRFTVDATDDGLLTGVRFLVNGIELGHASEPPFERLFTVPYGLTTEGPLTFGATASDSVDNVGTASDQLVMVEVDLLTMVEGAVVGPEGDAIAAAEVTLEVSGLRGEFFDFDTPLSTFPDLTGLEPDQVRLFSAINLRNPQSLLSPDTFGVGLSPDFAARFSGLVRIPLAGTYTFTLGADDGARLLIEDTPVVEVIADREFVEASGAVDLPAGQLAIEIEYFQAVSNAELQLSVLGPADFEPAVIPPEDLRPSPAAFTSLTDGEGRFAVPDVPTVLGDLQATARTTIDGVESTGTSASFPPVPGGTTDLGTFEIASAEFEPDFGTPLQQSDDDSDFITFSQGYSFPFFGIERIGIYVNSNGNLTFDNPDTTFNPPLPGGVIDTARISPLFTDLNPGVGGGVYVNQFPDRLVITWADVPQFGEGGSNTLQVILFDSGRIQFGYNGLTADGFGDGAGNDTLDISVAISPGNSPGLRIVDYSLESPFTSLSTEAPFQLFDTDGSFDLDGGFLLFHPGPANEYEVDFVLPPAIEGVGAIQGVVFDTQGEPVARVPVVVHSSRQDGGSGTTTTDENGRFQIDALPAVGLYRLIAFERRGLHRIGSAEVTLSAADEVVFVRIDPMPQVPPKSP